MTDLEKSLPKILELLNMYGTISGYKVNMMKSEVMPVDPCYQLTTIQPLPIKICTYKFKYLGIWITRVFKDLYEANFPPLIDGLKKGLALCSLLPLSLGGRINVVKMNIKPRFSLLFQCIPFFLSKFFFHKFR